MKKNKGFAFIETVITVVVLSASLLYIYNSYNSIIRDEEVKLYYDDVAYIYKTNYLRRYLEEYANLDTFKNNDIFFEDSYIMTIGSGSNLLFDSKEKERKMEFLELNYNISQMVLVKSKMLDECINDDKDICENSLKNLSYKFRSYINTLNSTDYDYYLVVEYSEIIRNDSGKIEKCIPGSDINCISHYASLGL